MVKRRSCFVALFPLLTGCTSVAVGLPASDLETRSWRISQVYDGAAMVRPEEAFSTSDSNPNNSYPPGDLDIAFEKGEVRGRAGCGIFVARYEQKQNYIVFSDAGMLVILAGACSSADISYSGKLEAALNGDKVVVGNGDSRILKTLTGNSRIVLVPSQRQE